MAHCWQQKLNDGDYHGALQSQGRPSFVPGDGSWADWIYRHMHHREHSSFPVDTFLEHVSQLSLTVDEHDVYWKCYTNLCRYYQQPIRPCVYHADFVKHTAPEYAKAMAQRGDIEGLDIVCHHFQLVPCWEWIDLLPCTLEPRFYLHLIPWNDVHVEANLMSHVQRRFAYTGQAEECLKLIAKAFQYSTNQEFPRLQLLREEYMNLCIRELPSRTRPQEQQETVTTATPFGRNKSVLAKQERYRFARRIMHSEDTVQMWQEATCVAQQEAEASRRDCQAKEDCIAGLRAETSLLVSGIHAIADSIQAFANAMKELNDEHGQSVLDFLQDLHECLNTLGDSDLDETTCSDDIFAQKQALQIAKLESQVEKLQCRLVESETKEVLRQHVSQLSFSSLDTVDDTESKESYTQELQELQETICMLEKQLQVQAHEHDMERMGDKARIEYLLGMMDETKSTTRSCSPTNDELAMALEVSEDRRDRAVQDLHRERELYAEKMKQLMLAVQQMEARRSGSSV